MSRKLLVGTVVLSVGILAAVFGLTSPKSIYARSVSDFVAHPIYDQTVRISGPVVPGSICLRREPCEYRFRLFSRQAELAVHYPQCMIPDTFLDAPRAEVSVTVEGEMCANCHHFEASVLYAKMSGKYEMKARDAPPEPRLPPPRCPEP